MRLAPRAPARSAADDDDAGVEGGDQAGEASSSTRALRRTSRTTWTLVRARERDPPSQTTSLSPATRMWPMRPAPPGSAVRHWLWELL
jgi:hypothetical protein